MKHSTTMQEIILMTETDFTSSLPCLRDETEQQRQLSDQEKIEEACWNGLLLEMLPELFDNKLVNKDLFLWKMVEGSSFLELEYSKTPEKKEPYFSIEPYAFMDDSKFN